MSIRAITFNKMTCKSEDDALIFDTFLNHINGRIRGINLTYDTKNLFLSVGYFMAQGRLVNIFGAHTIPIPPVETGDQYVQVVYEIDLSKINTPMDFQQGAFKLLTSFDGWQRYLQEDLFSGGCVYQIPFARMKNNVNGVHSFEAQLDSIDIPTLYNQLSIENQEYRSQFDVFYNEQKKVILDMIRQLSDQGFVTAKDFATTLDQYYDKTHSTTIFATQSQTGTLSNLKTTVKTNLVNAINELCTGVSNKINKTDIVHSVEIVDPNKVIGADVFNSEITRLNSDITKNFQVGCNKIVAALTAKGQPPVSNSPNDIVAAINKLSNVTSVTIAGVMTVHNSDTSGKFAIVTIRCAGQDIEWVMRLNSWFSHTFKIK